MPSPLNSTFGDWFRAGYRSAARRIGAMRRPYAITSQGTSMTSDPTASASTTAAATAASPTECDRRCADDGDRSRDRTDGGEGDQQLL